MDPFDNINEYLHNLVLQHLTVDEVLEDSLVSRKWYKTIGKSDSAMQTVWLNIGDRYNEPSREDVKAFRASERNYQNFKMSEVENVQILLFPRRKWKRARIDIQSFITYRDYVNLLLIFNETVEELEIFDMDIEFVDFDINIDNLLFQSLKMLRVGFVTSLALEPLSQTHCNFKTLVLEDIKDSDVKHIDNATEMTEKFLKLQPHLKNLSLSSNIFEKIFTNENIFDFQLDHILVEYSGNSDCEPTKNFEKFIESQKSLKRVTLCEWTNLKTFEHIFNCSTVERISFDYFDNDSSKLATNLLHLKNNNNISMIDFECEFEHLIWFEPILKFVPEVQSLYFFHLTKEILEYILANCKKLKTIRYCSFSDEGKEFYKNLENRKSIDIMEDKFVDLKKMF